MLPKTLTAEVSSMTVPLTEKAEAFSDRESGPQGLRRPRFSFFRFTCQTARNLAARRPVHLAPARIRQGRRNQNPAHPTRRREHGHQEHGRMLGHRVNSEGLRRRAID